MTTPEPEPTNGHPGLTDGLGIFLILLGATVLLFGPKLGLAVPHWMTLIIVGVGLYMVNPGLIRWLFNAVKDRLPWGAKS